MSTVAAPPRAPLAPPSDPPQLAGLQSSQHEILIEGLIAYFAVDSIKKSIDGSCDRCENNCDDQCDKSCDDACDKAFKCEMVAAPKRHVTSGEVIVTLLFLIALPLVHSVSRRRQGSPWGRA